MVQGFYEVQSTTWNVWCLWKGPPFVPLIQGLFFGWDFGVFARSFDSKDCSLPHEGLVRPFFFAVAFAGTHPSIGHGRYSEDVCIYSVLVMFHYMKDLTATKKSSCSKTQFNM